MSACGILWIEGVSQHIKDNLCLHKEHSKVLRVPLPSDILQFIPKLSIYLLLNAFRQTEVDPKIRTGG